jgi:hypothetical protein
LGEELDPSHHLFRYVGGSKIQDGVVDSSAFWRTEKNGVLEAGVSLNWVEWFGKDTPEEAVEPLREVFRKKGRTIAPTSQFALLNMGDAKEKAFKYAAVSIAHDPQPDDESHALISGYQEALNEQVAEQLAKSVIASFPGKMS